jgi:hypothetical protein
MHDIGLGRGTIDDGKSGAERGPDTQGLEETLRRLERHGLGCTAFKARHE